MKYPEGKGAIEVVDGGGQLAGYGSAEIVVVFAPLTVGEFRTVKVGLTRGVELSRVIGGSHPFLHSFSRSLGGHLVWHRKTGS